MAKRKVTKAVEIDYRNMTDKQLSDVYRLDVLKSEWSCTCFDAEDDYYVCLQDVEDTTDDRGYAVYLKSTGDLLCLVADCGTALDGYEDTDYGVERNELYKQIALLAGWPESMYDLKVGMTWRQLIVEMLKVPTEFLDTPAYAWRPDGGGTLAAVRGVRPWYVRYCDGTVPGPGGEDDNVYYIDNGFPNEE